jgi:hypothetical protein
MAWVTLHPTHATVATLDDRALRWAGSGFIGVDAIEGPAVIMLKRLAKSAYELDEWLHQNVGRAYVAILGWGLVASIIGSLTVLSHALSSGRGGLTPLLTLVFQSALLVNQLAQWHELRERRRRRKEAVLGARAGPGAAGPGG